MTQEQRGSSRHRDLDVTVASQRRRQIIDAARECITEEGVEKLTLRKVGDRAGVSHATIAYYFHSRRELMCCITSADGVAGRDFEYISYAKEILYQHLEK